MGEETDSKKPRVSSPPRNQTGAVRVVPVVVDVDTIPITVNGDFRSIRFAGTREAVYNTSVNITLGDDPAPSPDIPVLVTYERPVGSDETTTEVTHSSFEGEARTVTFKMTVTDPIEWETKVKEVIETAIKGVSTMFVMTGILNRALREAREIIRGQGL